MATKKEIERADAISNLKAWLPEILDPTSFLELSTEYTRGQTDYVTVKLFYVKDGRGHVVNLGYNVARACGYRQRSNSHQLGLGGGGYSKSYDVALAMFRALGIERDQVNFSY